MSPRWIAVSPLCTDAQLKIITAIRVTKVRGWRGDFFTVQTNAVLYRLDQILPGFDVGFTLQFFELRGSVDDIAALTHGRTRLRLLPAWLRMGVT